jgi:YVTN family beta-propeller protein
MRFGVLGPVEAVLDDAPLGLGGPRPRTLLAILLLNANTVVSRDRLIDGLWGESPPPSAGHTLDDYLSRLRKALGPGRLTRQPPGYVLHVEAAELDLDRFAQLVELGRAELARGDASRAATSLREALGIWRGRALGGVLFEPFVARAVAELEEQRLGAIESRIEADLATGKDAELVAELERLVREHPLRERLTGHLMLALYRAGRQSDALEAYRIARARLADELGLEPSPQLGDLERRILTHDPTLALTALSGVVRRVRGRLGLVVAFGALVAAGAIGAGVHLLASDTRKPAAAARGAQLVLLGRSGATPIPVSAGAIASGATSVWLAESDLEAVVRVDRRTRQIVDRIPLGANPTTLAIAGGSVWAGTGTKLSRIDPKTETVVQTLDLGGATASAVAPGGGVLWVADTADGALIGLDPVRGIPLRTVTLGLRPTSLAVGADAIWAADYDRNTVAEIDPRSGRTLATIHVGNGPSALAVAPGAVWVANALDATVSRIEPASGSVVATIPVGTGPGSLAVSGGEVWVASEYSQTLARIDPKRNAVVETVPVGGGPTALAVADGTVWTATRPLVSHRGGTLVLLGSVPFPLDPALNFNVPPSQSNGLTGSSLVTFAHSGGPAGQRLVPNLAIALPAPTDRGTTYTFRLRPAIRYSDGRSLRASDFRSSFERLFELRSPASGYFADIVGAEACRRRGVLTCNLSRGVVADDAAGTVTFHLVAPDANFLFKLTIGGFSQPVPPGTPRHDTGYQPVPGTGPYEVASAGPREIRYVRNPYFREWSHVAQPDGNPDTIVWRFGMSPAAEVRAVTRGSADWTSDGVPASLLPEVSTRFADRIHSSGPGQETDFFQLNTTVAPFNDIRVRRALNYALDRRVIVRIYGGLAAARPTCQILPPAIPGYRQYCPYTLEPSANGTYSAPNMTRARRLVVSSGTAATSVTVWGPSTDATISPAVTTYTADVLRRLGYHVRTRLLTHAQLSRLPERAFRTIQLIATGWAADYPSAFDFVQIWLSCRGDGDHGWFCDPAIDRQVKHADSLEVSDPSRASALWATIDRELVDRAVWVPLANPRLTDLVSARVTNYQSNPFTGILADQLWLR